MEQFRTYLKQIELNIPESDKEYYRMVTKPIYEQLMSEIEYRFELLKAEIKPVSVSVSQSQLVTGCVDIYDFRHHTTIRDYFDPIIDVNQNVEGIVRNENRNIQIRLNLDKEGYLFSFLSPLPYSEYLTLVDTIHELILSDDKGIEKTKCVVYKINKEYEHREKQIKELFISNRPQESYFDIPICRRFIDVFLVDEVETKGTFDVKVSSLPGKICIPVWNLVSDGKVNSGSRKNQIVPSDKRVIMPYGMTGEQNQFSISFENCPYVFSDAFIRIKDYFCNYFFTKYFNEKHTLKLYTNDKKVWGSSYFVYGITQKTKEVLDLLDNKIDYACLEGCGNRVCQQTEITRAVICYFANIFYDITHLKVDQIKENKDDVEISFVSDNDSDVDMSKEYLEFLLGQYNSSFVGRTFTGRVVERG